MKCNLLVVDVIKEISPSNDDIEWFSDEYSERLCNSDLNFSELNAELCTVKRQYAVLNCPVDNGVDLGLKRFCP